jgi:putative intracellular protease/amidase
MEPGLHSLLCVGIAAAALAGCSAEVAVPPPQADAAALEREAQAFLEAMRPRRAGRPVIAVVARNEGTETTDFLLTHAVLQRAGVAEVYAVAPRRGRVSLYPVFEVEVAQDLAGFDRAHPSGADYVIVPAMDDADVPAITGWLRRQAAKGARIMSVCAGALILGRAGLLDGRRFTTHWYYRKTALERHPGAVYVPHRRYVADRGVATTTGISASVPAMLALVEAIGGRAKAQTLAAELGVDAWSPAHDSSRFALDLGRMSGYLLDKAAFWRHEDWAVDVRDGTDDIALALAADAWTRTGHVGVAASAPAPVKLRSSLVLAARPVPSGAPRLPLAPSIKPVRQLERTLCEIAERFGAERRDWVAMELEYASAPDCNGRLP